MTTVVNNIKNVGITHDAIQELKKTLKTHTYLLGWTLVMLIVLLGLASFWNAWQGKYTSHFEDIFEMEHHEWILNLSEMVGYDHPLHDFHETAEERGHVHSDHPHHHSKIEEAVLNHEQKEMVAFVLAGCLVSALTLLMRYILFFERTWVRVMMTMMVILSVSILLQMGAIILLIYICWIYFTTPNFIVLVLQSWVIILELATFDVVYSIRQKYHYLKFLHHQLLVELAENKKTLQGHTTTSIHQHAQRILGDPQEIKSFLKEFYNRFQYHFTNNTTPYKFKRE
jgi:hypothetical protein